MMLDDVIGSDCDEFPLEQVRHLLDRLALDEDWDEPGALRQPESSEFDAQGPRQERLSG